MIPARAQSWLAIRWLAFVAIAGSGAVSDLLTKHFIFQWRGLPGVTPPWWLVEPYVGIQTAVNPGALFGFGAGWGSFFATLSVIAGVGIFVWLWRFGAINSWWLIVSLGCVLAGIVGNLYDRLGMWYLPEYPAEWRNGVRDWILFQYPPYVWPNFNIADCLLVCGAIMLTIHSFKTPAPESANSRSASHP
ncbi:MAG: signal peptidase II [Planctomycetales bacterium]|nr:signal peptidase II [Planctomycetales bacterium]